MNPKVLVIIVTYNGIQWINKCIESVLNSTINPDIYIVDNGSTDGTIEFIIRFFSHNKNIIFYQSPKNLFFGKANNIGLQYALDNNYEYAYLLNQDAWVFPYTIANLISIQKNNSKYGIISPFQIQANANHLDYNFAKNVCSWDSNSAILDDLVFNRLKTIYSVPCVMAAHWLISRECIEKVGGFSPSFIHYGEDTNYANRAIYHGFQIGISPSDRGIHDREDRKITKDKIIYMAYIDNLILLSNIVNKSNMKLLRIIIHTLRICQKTHSFKPFIYLFKLLYQLPYINKNKIKSMNVCAFLNSNT